ncbi:MAG: CotH kinase family protein [Oscillospiraceae bacterium]|nr:CotH kinase family protein [Oscillospiraceae bacterium]
MIDKRKFRSGIILRMIGVLAVFVLVMTVIERGFCMGVPTVGEEYLKQFKEVDNLDLSQITFNSEKAAAYADKVVYISQPVEALSDYHKLVGEFGSTNPDAELYIVRSYELYNLRECTANDMTLQIILKEGQNFQRVYVVISTLPVINLNGVETDRKDDEGRAIISGEFSICSGYDPSTESFTFNKSNAEWHIRGATAAMYGKKPLKVALKNKNGENNNLNLLGMGEDDDWILNPLSLEDTKIREKLAIELWNSLEKSTEHNLKMSNSEYVEVVINGEYHGLYMLQRRIDEKYLNLNKDRDILIKGKQIWKEKDVIDTYEVVYSPIEYTKAIEILDDALNNKNGSRMNINNFIDVNLLLNYCSSGDNCGNKNMYYLLRSIDEGYELYLVPWDTDMSFGIAWIEEYGYNDYNYEKSMNRSVLRQEYKNMKKIYPELDIMMAQRWKELRDEVYTTENISGIIWENNDKINQSASFTRDINTWWTNYDGEDTVDNLYIYCVERLRWMDNYYDEIIAKAS